MARKIVFLSMPIEALLEVISGRATIKLPKDLPPDPTLLYSFIEQDSQTLKIALSHPSLEPVKAGGYVKTHSATIEVIETKKEEEPKGYSGDSLVNTEDWSRLV